MAAGDPAHVASARRAAAHAARVLAHFESAVPRDPRPRRAIEAARAWARGAISVAEARRAALAAHAAARAATAPSAVAAARAAGHAAATAHVSTHARWALYYAEKAAVLAAPGALTPARTPGSPPRRRRAPRRRAGTRSRPRKSPS